MFDAFAFYGPMFASIISVITAGLAILYYLRERRRLIRGHAEILRTYGQVIGDLSREAGTNLIRFQPDMGQLLTGASETLSQITGKPVSASIKLFREDKGTLNVVTYARDSASTHQREVLKYDYPVNENIAFHSVIVDPENIYMDNNLEDRGKGGYYRNVGKDWQLLYKSILVVSIVGDDNTVIGALAFDSPKEYAFSAESVRIAHSVSELVGSLLKRILNKDDGASDTFPEVSSQPGA